MPGIFGIFSNELASTDFDQVVDTINPIGLCNIKKIEVDGIGFLGVSSLNCAPLKGSRYFRNEEWIIAFAGDLINYVSVPYEEIIYNLVHKEFNNFERFSGIYTITAYNTETKQLFIITDRLSLHPIYYMITKDEIIFSTKLSTFCRLKKNLIINEKWICEYLFFNYPIGETTYIKDIKRVNAASVLEVDLKTKTYSQFEYAKKFHTRLSSKNRKKTLETALEIFSNRIAEYYEENCNMACALSGGWDARTVLAFCPALDRISSYTYGIEGCSDLKNATLAAKSISINHKRITFGNEFEKDLPKYILNTIYVTSGLQGVLRSNLLYVYSQLYKDQFSLVLSGIFFDNIYRGHMNYPSQNSQEMRNLMINGKQALDYSQFKLILKDDYHQLFIGHISEKIEEISKKYGNFTSPEFHLSYQLYELLRNYFGGEVSIANEFATIRIPALDSELIDFAYNSPFSALTFSEYAGHKRGFEENILQAFLISQKNLPLSKAPVGGLIQPNAILKGKLYFSAYCKYKNIINGIVSKISPIKESEQSPLENWDYWLNDLHKEFIDSLIFSKNSIVRKYLKSEYLEKLKETRDIHWIGKIATLEVILRLFENNWRIAK